MNSIFRYCGGKSRKSVRDTILGYSPGSYSEYREACVGGGGIFWSIPTSKKRWINDVDSDLMSVYFALRDRPEEFINLCRSILPAQKGEHLAPAKSGKPLYNARLKEKFVELLGNVDVDKALKYFFVNRTVWAGRVNYSQESRLYFSNPNGWNIVFKEGVLEEAVETLRGTNISVGDFSNVLESDGDDCWIYVDPPYMKDTMSSAGSKLYSNSFSVKDHSRLRDQVRSSSHKIMVSYDDLPEVRSLYDDFCIIEASWTYCGTSSAKSSNAPQIKKKGKELIIVNYDIGV